MRADEARGWEIPPSSIEPEDVGLFLPRAVLFVPSWTLKAVFWPLQKAIRFTERHALIEHVKDILYNDERTAGITPVFSFLSSVGPSGGAKLFHDNLGGYGEHAALDVSFGGRYTQAYQLSFDADRLLGSRFWLKSLTRFEMRPNMIFYGLGDRPEQDAGHDLGPRQGAVKTRYRQTRMLALAGAGYTIGRPGGLTKIGMTGILNHREFAGAKKGDVGDGEYSLPAVYDTSEARRLRQRIEHGRARRQRGRRHARQRGRHQQRCLPGGLRRGHHAAASVSVRPLRGGADHVCRPLPAHPRARPAFGSRGRRWQ